MTRKSHNKKRNVGIIYEQLILTVSKGIVKNNPKLVESAKSIIKKHFVPGTELYKEHKLFQALVKPHIDNDSLATSILGEAKKAARAHDSNRLEREKSRLIRDINLTFGKGFYGTRIKEYKEFATVQTLMNDWRQNSTNIQRIVEYEQKVHNILTSEKTVKTLSEHKSPDADNLVVKIMTEKFNQKYGSKLTDQQSMLIKNYVMSDKKINFESTLNSIRENCIRELNRYSINCESSIVKSKIDPVILELKQLDTANLNDENFSKFMTLCHLQKELKERTNG
tara:strand:+ start:18865 stop:19707 length:843 start_codon:yes stop_codon:yes gene_type:complete